jgi:hypothetical protein
MYDVFSSEGDAGVESTQSVAADTPEPSKVDNAPDAFESTSVDNADSAAAAGNQEPTDQATTAADQGAQGTQDGTSQQRTSDPEKELSPDDLAEIEKEVDAALADERTPKWFNNVSQKVYRPKIQQLTSQVEKYSAFGEPEQVAEKIGLVEQLYAVKTDPATRMPVKDPSGFAQAVYEKDPEITLNLMGSLGQLPDPNNPDRNLIQSLFHQMGIDHNRLPDIQRFAQNGYQQQAAQYAPADPQDLAIIPQHLHATFSKLSPEIRDSLMADSDAVREQNLEAHRYRLETEERNQAAQQQQQQAEQQQVQERQQKFAADVDAKADELFEKSGEGVLTSFVDSLAKQAGMSQLDALSISNTVLNSFEPTLAGRRTQAALKEAGIEIDPAIPQAISELQELSRHAAYYTLVNDKQSLQVTASKIAETQERVIAKSNKVIAALAKLRSTANATPIKAQADALAATETDRHAFSGTPRSNGASQTPRTPMDFSDEAYLEDLRASGFGRRAD